MSKTVDIKVHHVTRVEGHGNIRVRAKDGAIEKLEWQVPEAPRFFEAMVRGRKYEDIQTIVSRICGICSVTHSLAAIKAIERAMDTPVTDQTDRLRILAHYGEQLESHILHVGYLVAPDLLGQKSVVPVASSHPEVVQTVITLHRLGNTMMEVLTGRKTHPVRLVPGGFSMLPSAKELRALKQELVDSVPKLTALAEVIASLAGGIPSFTRETEYVALVNEPHYPFYHGQVGSTDISELASVQDFEDIVNEYVIPQSTAKWAKWHREAYMVGSLARFNLNAEFLAPLAKQTAAMLGLEKGCYNPYMNSVVQVVESVQVVERSIELIDEILTVGLRVERPDVKIRAGVGAAAVEAPRGILFHRYEFDDKGECVSANMTIPTNQNHGNIQKDFEALVPTIIDRPQDEIRQVMEMLVRAYDPCISCSTHYLDVEFV
ncbi:MAG: Ni/Fe hydrogenase subunit alpha [Planctomycetes bacterium]|nr:Ni/Fe hydrogenase subunit alpha [Planctomycetota bacterium]MCP4770232.1 Ni/Fe hydrogenase subunit alpha [Planctomycetota bacterium]MCP4860620.1 Ni/Fe hydrogenase subunit alpha [Planctomycetota bacterium]